MSESIVQYIVLHQSCRNHVGVAAVQAAHAAGESAREKVSSETYVVVLVADKSDEIEALARRVEELGNVQYAMIREPDPPYFGSVVALGVEPLPKSKIASLFVHLKPFR